MKEYHKINSIFKRDPDTNNFLIGEWSTPELQYLKDLTWEWYEKIDGTNIRVGWQETPPTSSIQLEIAGRTNKADIPEHLLNKLKEILPADKVFTYFKDAPSLALYGEGFGHKIQSGGKYLGKEVSFCLFDVKVGNWWLEKPAVEKIAEDLNIPVAPKVGEGTLEEAIEFVKPGFKSQWGDFNSEGIIAVPKVHLKDRAGRRIITKIKEKDFRFLQN